MDWKILEKIFDHLERCQRDGKILQLSIDDDLPKILPLPQKLILDFFSEAFMSKIFRLSNDQQAFLFDNHVSHYLFSFLNERFISIFSFNYVRQIKFVVNRVNCHHVNNFIYVKIIFSIELV